MEFLCFIVTRATHILTILVCWLMEALLKSSISVHLFDNSKFPHYELPQSSPTMSCQVDGRGQGFSFLKFGQRWGSRKKLFGRGGLVKGGGALLERGFKLFHQFSFRKACFHYHWNTFFSFFVC